MTIRIVSLLVCCAILLARAAQAAEPDEWHLLFNGRDLAGWKQHGGKAQYTVEGDEIVGTSVLNTPNSFLCTEQEYQDFVLEIDFKVDPPLNSGIQIRSHVFDEPTTFTKTGADGKPTTGTIPAGRVHGYQVEIDPSPRAWTGGIYDEGRRGWLFDLTKNDAARQAFRQNEWNHFRIECRGDSIRTWLNDVAAADLHDQMTPRGFICLQVHGIGNETANAGKQVRWRNIRLRDLTATAN
jgi:hypothetical protein